LVLPGLRIESSKAGVCTSAVDLLAWLAAISGCVDVHPDLHHPAWASLGRLWTRSPRFEHFLGCERVIPAERVGFRVRLSGHAGLPSPHRSRGSRLAPDAHYRGGSAYVFGSAFAPSRASTEADQANGQSARRQTAGSRPRTPRRAITAQTARRAGSRCTSDTRNLRCRGLPASRPRPRARWGT
jgi:hypothetical protein